MLKLNEIINNIQKKKSNMNSERAEVISQFIEEINKERVDTKFKPVSTRAIAIKLSHLNLASLYTFLSLCRDYKHRQGAFGKYFFGALKIK